MSNRTPIILKKDDSQRATRVQSHKPIQPKILTKANNKESVPIVPPKKIDEPQCPQMKKSARLMHPHFQVDQKVFEFLDSENIDFLVVGVCGLKNVGKSTLMNVVASQGYLSDDEGMITFQPDGVFQTTGVNYEGSVIDMFITSDRIIFLDTSPLISNVQKRDMIVSECDDIKTMLLLLQLCHLVLVVHNGYPDISVARILTVADQMVPNNLKQRPSFVYIGNKVQPGTKLLESDSRLTGGPSLLVPNLQHPSVHLHHDVDQVIQDLQEKVYMMKRWSMAESEDEPFTEKKWGQRLLAAIDHMKNDFFLRKYEGFRDKFHQPIEI